MPQVVKSSKAMSQESITILTRLLAYFLMSALTTVALLPLLSSGYYSDDLINSTLNGQIGLESSSLLKNLIGVNQHWIHANGRFFPVASIMVLPVAYIFSTLLTHKIFILMMIIVNVLLFSRFVETLTKNFFTGCLAVLTLPILFQFRLFHDPILSFSGMMQSFMTLTLLSLILFQEYLKRDRLYLIAASLFFYNLSLYFYEISIPLVLLFLILVIGNNSHVQLRPQLRKVLPYIASTACALLIMGIARLMRDPATTGYDGITLNFEAISIFKTLLVQISAAMPLSYYLFDPSNLFNGIGIGWPTLQDALSIAGFAAAYWYISRRIIGGAVIKLLLLGITLLFFPALLTSLSLKYQKELRLGLGYLPVYVEYFGVGLVAVGLVAYLQRNLAGWSRHGFHLGVCTVLSLCLLLNLQNNRAVVTKANIDVHYRRAALVKSLEENILEQVPDNAKLLILDEYVYDPQPAVRSDLRGWAETGYPWKNAALVYQFSQKRLQVMNAISELRKYPASSDQQDVYLLTIKSYPHSMGIQEGYVVLSQINQIMIDETGNVRFQTLPLKSNFPPNK